MTQIPSANIQLFYARVLDWATKLAFILLLCTFAIYIFGVIEPFIPLEDLPQYWSQPARHYLQATQLKTGWAWVEELHHGDILNFLPIAILAAVTIFGYGCLVLKFFRHRELTLGIIIILQMVVLSLAASGILKTGGH